jgi:hypothetical protein
MRSGLQELRDDQPDEALERALLPQLTEVISHREPGHCLQVTDLSAGLTARLSGGCDLSARPCAAMSWPRPRPAQPCRQTLP